MGFLDNSSSIICDVVLSDEGRARLAKGDGSFKIAKFALFDDEINYGLYNKSHASGSAYYDLQILQTPILEAFTNNTSWGASKLLSIARTNLLYLPVIKVNDIIDGAHHRHSIGAFVVAVDSDTETSYPQTDGVLWASSLNGGNLIRVDQGLDTTEIPPAYTLDSDLVETQYIIEIDNRFAKLVAKDGTVARLSYIDDDNIGSYYLSLGTDPSFVHKNEDRTDVQGHQVIKGPRGTFLEFKLQASLELNTSTYLFDQIGSTVAADLTSNGTAVLYIDTVVKVSGATVGSRVDVPLRLIKNA